MRKTVVSVLVLGLMSFGAPVGLFAQVAQQGSIAGEALDLDAGGRPLANVRVELLQAVVGQPLGGAVQVTTTSSRGAWAFTGVEPGDYVVKLIVDGQVAGIPVVVGAGEVLNGLLIVAGSEANTDPAFLAGLSTTALLATVGTIAALTAATIVIRRGDNVTICHLPTGVSPNTIEVSENALPVHQGHGDTLGACPASP